MAFYFSIFPKIKWKDDAGNSITITDISRRYRFLETLLPNKYIFYEYVIREGERADVIAEKYYGDETLDYLIWLMNLIVDPFFDWPMDYDEFVAFIDKKYGSAANAQSTTAKYYRIVQAKEILYDDTMIAERKVEVDATEYATIPANERSSISVYNYEIEQNDLRRHIKLIDKGYMAQIVSELEALAV
jgi:hypothetical protein